MNLGIQIYQLLKIGNQRLIEVFGVSIQNKKMFSKTISTYWYVTIMANLRLEKEIFHFFFHVIFQIYSIGF